MPIESKSERLSHRRKRLVTIWLGRRRCGRRYRAHDEWFRMELLQSVRKSIGSGH